MRQLMLVLVTLCASTVWLATATASRDAGQKSSAVKRAALRQLKSKVVRFEQTTWRWQRLMDVPLAKTNGRVVTRMGVPAARRVVAEWRTRARTAARHAHHPPNLGAWLCIHRYEGSWSDAGAPYYGGLQMSLSFQERYGFRLFRSKGTANHWTPLEQIWVAEKARRSGRGFYPWPNTARYCGLI